MLYFGFDQFFIGTTTPNPNLVFKFVQIVFILGAKWIKKKGKCAFKHDE